LRIRSILFTPATKLDKLPRARAVAPDWVTLDLEDGVAPADKAGAREALSALASRGFDDMTGATAVRVNTLASPDGVRDLAAMLDWPVWPGLVILPKVESPPQIEQVAAVAQACGKSTALFATFETARGVDDAGRILANAPSVAAVGYGSADHTAETGGGFDWQSLYWARGRIANAAAMAGIPAVDGVWLDFRDEEGLRQEAEAVRNMGFVGKIAIHPGQVAAINDTFTPGEAETTQARELLEAAKSAGGGAFEFRGRMIDKPVLRRAERIVAASKRREE
jgi:(S)-citramalyl-CoA lyase